MAGFFVSAPVLAAAPPDAESASLPAQSASPSSIQPPRILFVEDYAGMRSLVDTMLESTFEVECAANYQEALKHIQETPFDLFLIDIDLDDDANGVDLLHTLHDHPTHRDTPTVACTAYVSPDERKRILNAGFDGYLSKPFRKERLVSLLWTFLSDRPD